MRQDELFDYCVDITAVHYPKREAQFDIVYILYSFHHNERVRVKTQIKDGEQLAHRRGNLGDGKLAGARGLRHVRHRVRWASRLEAHSAARRMEGPSAAQGLSDSAAGPGMGADQPRHREWTMSDRTDYLDLDTKDETFLDATELVLNMGPQHPSTHGVLRVILKLDGEKVLGTECVIGYLHRGVEKIAREPHLRNVQSLRGPHGLRRRGVQRAGLLRGCREAPERGSAAAGAIHSRHPYGAVPHRQPPGLAGHARARYRRDYAAVLLLPRSRRGAEDFRKVLRRAPDDTCISHRRLPVRGLRRF